MHQPYRQEVYNKIYNLLFCDDVSLYQKEDKNGIGQIGVWDVFLSNHPDQKKLLELSVDKTLESRQRILAYHLLKKQQVLIPEKVLLGVIVEVGLEGGLDTLAAYKDGTARYINHAENLIIWESPTAESNSIIENLFTVGQHVVNQIGPWDGERRAAPETGMCRLTFLVSGGLYFGEGPFDVFQTDPMAGPVISAATEMFVFLTQKVMRGREE